MNLLVLYLLLAKATLTSFSGMTSLPVVRHDFVEARHILTDRQLNAAVAAGRIAPGPTSIYLVSVGYFAAGYAGAALGTLAVVTPAFLIIPLLRFLGRRAERPRVRSAIQCLTIAASGLIVNATLPLARDSLTGAVPALIAIASFLFLTMTKQPTIWAMLGAAAAGLLNGLFRP